MCIRVDLPDPDGPMIAVELALGEVDADAVEGADRGLALAEHAASAPGR